MMNNIQKVALVVGGTTGIGYGIAKQLCAENILVYVVGRRNINSNSNNIRHIKVDLFEPDAIQKIVYALENNRLDYIVLSAATEKPLKSFSNISPDDFDFAFHLNLKVHFFLIQKIVCKQKLANRAKVVLLSSRLAITPEAGSLIYGMTKAAVDNFARGLQIELGEQFSVVTINPGITDTEMQKRLREESSLDFEHQELYEKMKSKLQSIEQVSKKIVNQLLDL